MAGRELELHPMEAGRPQEALSRSDRCQLGGGGSHDCNSVKGWVHTLEVDLEAGVTDSVLNRSLGTRN